MLQASNHGYGSKLSPPSEILAILHSLWLFYLLLLAFRLLPHATSLSFNLNLSQTGGYDYAVADFSLQGHAKLHSQAIELTKNDMSVGRVSYAHPVPIWDDATGELASFTTTFSFQIVGGQGQHLNGDGMAFFLGNYPSSIPTMSIGGGLGLISINTSSNDTNATTTGDDDRILAVEFDTFLNPEYLDGSNNHMGIDINSLISKEGTNTTVPGASLDSGLVMACRIGYDNSTRHLVSDLQIGGTSYHVETVVDLKQLLPSVVAVGFSAATGVAGERHRLMSWSFNSTLDHRPPQGNQDPSSSSSNSPGVMVTRIIAAGAVVVGVIAGLACLMQLLLRLYKRKKPDYDDAPANIPRWFDYDKLAKATNSFAEECKLGEGGYAIVYKGQLRNPSRRVAIKKFKPGTCAALGRRAFDDEIRVISQVRHRNLVELVGWYNDGDKQRLLLVYELVSQGSLNEHLHNGRSWLSWATRYEIILDLGCALRYLHAECRDCILHGDIKPCNILLDSQYVAMLADFGLARFVNHGIQSQTTSNVAGTMGYVDPEFVYTGRRSRESDVYSFGIVLLEIVSGRRPAVVADESESMATPLLMWVWGIYRRNAILEAADARLRDESTTDDQAQMERVLQIGLWCAHPHPSQRPPIAEAVKALQWTSDTTDIPAALSLLAFMPRPLSLATTAERSSGTSDGALSSDAGRADVDDSGNLSSLC